jgi:hypothetical protein
MRTAKTTPLSPLANRCARLALIKKKSHTAKSSGLNPAAVSDLTCLV